MHGRCHSGDGTRRHDACTSGRRRNVFAPATLPSNQRAFRMKGWSLQTLPGALSAFAALAVLVASPAAAQSSPPGGALPAVERMLQVFEEDAVENRTGGTEGIAAVQWALMHPAQVAPAKLDSVLAGMER